MKEILQPKLTQQQRILQVLKDANGGWVNGAYFIQTMLISQAHARIFQLQKEGYNIEASEHKNEYGFKFYRLVERKEQASLFNKVEEKELIDRRYCGY